MKKNWLRRLLLGLSMALLLGGGVALAQSDVLYGCTGRDHTYSSFYTIDPSTGAATLVGPMGMQACSGLAFDLDGTLYAVGLDPILDQSAVYTVNPGTGAATLVGRYGSHDFGDRIGGISTRSDGALFAYLQKWVTNGLGTLNKATGDVNEIGPTGQTSSGNGIAFDSADVLWHGNDWEVQTLNQTTGAALPLPPGHDLDWSAFPPSICPSEPRINAMDFNSGGTLFASVNCGCGECPPNNFLATVNTTTGVVTNIGRTVDLLDGIVFQEVEEVEFVPEPGSILLLGTGLAGLAGYATLRWRARE